MPASTAQAWALFASSYAVVFLLGAQSLAVNNGRYLLAFCNSALIGLCHVAFYRLVPEASAPELAAFVAGGPMGIVSAMFVFRHLHRRSQ